MAKMFIRLDTIELRTELQDLKPPKSLVFFHLVKHSLNIMGYPYGKLKYLDLLQVYFLAKMFIGLDSL